MSDGSAIELVSPDFFPAAMLYRRACATAHQARQRATEAAQTGRHERRLRELDAVVETIVLAQAAAEGWIHRAYHLADVEPQRAGGWVARWQAAPQAICGPGTRDLDAETGETLRWLSTWRNFLVHDDARARERLRANGFDAGSAAAHLTADMAEAVIARMDDAFTDIGACIGWRTLAGLNWHTSGGRTMRGRPSAVALQCSRRTKLAPLKRLGCEVGGTVRAALRGEPVALGGCSSGCSWSSSWSFVAVRDRTSLLVKPVTER